MRVITTGAKEQLLARIQCLRDVGGVYDDKIDDLVSRREYCCDEDFVRFSNNDPVQFSNNQVVEW